MTKTQKPKITRKALEKNRKKSIVQIICKQEKEKKNGKGLKDVKRKRKTRKRRKVKKL